jgi:signal peptidase I
MSRMRKFLFPDINLRFVIRTGLVAVVALIFFTWILIPFRIEGHSMSPTYQNGGVNFCNRLHYLFSSPLRHDVVAIRYSSTRIMLLKRILAVEGETLEFRQGQLYVDNRPVPEPYVAMPCEWDLGPRMVETGHVYVAGDNRGVPMLTHDFGQTPLTRIVGAPLW